jgi:hypothetical protein
MYPRHRRQLYQSQTSVPPAPYTVNSSLKFVIGLRNADGHVSEIRASLPIALVLPPYISSEGTTPQLDDSTVNHLSYMEANGDSLPTYESRIYDRLWDGVSYAGLDTSAMNTPVNLSRRASAENLREMNRSMPNPGDLEAGLRQALRERSRDDTGTSPQDHDHTFYTGRSPASVSGSTTPTFIAPVSRPNPQITVMTPLNDDTEHRVTPTSSPEMQHLTPTSSNGSLNISPASSDEQIDMGRLSRVPSYNTANSSILNLDPINNSLPTYANATSSTHLPVIQEQTRSRSSSTSSRSSGVQAGDMRSGLRSVGAVGSVYGSSQGIEEMRHFGMMRNLFSSSR